MPFLQCLIFVEPSPSSVSTRKKRVAKSSKKGSALKKYALFPSGRENHHFCNYLIKSGVEIIKNDLFTPPLSLKFEILEVLFNDSIMDVGMPVFLYHNPFNHGFAGELFSNTPEVINCFGCPSEREYFYSIHVAQDKEDFRFFESLLAAGVDLTVRHPEGGTLLHFAADRGYHFTYLAKLLIENGAEVNAKRKDGATPLHVAASKSGYQFSTEITTMLLDSGAALNARTVDGSTPLHRAARAGWVGSVRLFLERGAKVTAVTKEGAAPLHEAVEAQALEIVKLLVEKGAKIKAKSKDGTTPLHLAAGGGLDIVQVLLQNGADINARDVHGATPLLYSIGSLMEVSKLLIESGADINVQNEDGETALFLAVTKGCHKYCAYILSLNPDLTVDGNRRALPVALRNKSEKSKRLAEQLMEQGVEVAAEDVNDPNILFGAIHKNCVEVVRSLLEYGANVNQHHAFFSLKMSPLHFAIQCNHKNVVQLLLEYGADVNSKRGRCKSTPIVDAAERASVDIMEMLVAKGVKVRDEPTLLHLAASNASSEVVEYLLKEGFDPNDKTDRNGTPLSIAIQKGNLSAVEVMVQFGARVDFSDLAGKTASNPACLKSFLQLVFTPPDPANETIHEMLSQDFDERLGPDDRSCAKKLAKHLVKIEAVNQFFCARNVIPSFCYENFNFVDYESRCRLDIESMKLEKVGCTDVTFYEILIKNVSQIAYCARNQKFVSAIESCDVKSKYAIYGGILSLKVNAGCQRRKLVDVGIKTLGMLSPQFFALPHDLKEIVTDYLNNQDLCILCKFLHKTNSDT